MGIRTFAESSMRVLEQKRAGWRSSEHVRSGLRSLELYALLRIGQLPVSEVTSADVLEILTRICHTKGPMAWTAHMRVGTVLEWAIAMPWRMYNPCDRLQPVLGPRHDFVRPHRKGAAAIERVRASDPTKLDTLAYEFLVLTAARGREVGGRWREPNHVCHGRGEAATRRADRPTPRAAQDCGRAARVPVVFP